MRRLSLVLVVPVLLALGAPGMAASYGTATVEKGEMTIVRSGRSLAFKASPQPVDVADNDLVRVRNESRVVLKTRDKATLTLGANAVFQVQPWQTPQSSGTFRMLFGRMRAVVVGLSGDEQFNVKTATATIGVKGTAYRMAASSVGNTSVLGEDHTTSLAGRDGVPQDVGPNTISAVVGDNPSTPPVTAPPEVQSAMQSQDSPSPGSKAGESLPAEQVLVRLGVISQSELDKSKRSGPSQEQQQQAPTTEQQSRPTINLDDAAQASQAAKGKLDLHIEK